MFRTGLVTAVLAAAAAGPAHAQTPAEVLDKHEALIAKRMADLKPAVEALYHVVDWRQQKAAAAGIPAVPGKATLILADHLDLGKVEYEFFKKTCPLHFAVLADTLRVSDAVTVNVTVSDMMGRYVVGGSAVFVVRKLVWEKEARILYLSSGQTAGNLVVEAVEVEAHDFGKPPAREWDAARRVIDGGLPPLALGVVNGKAVAKPSQGGPSADLAAQAAALRFPPQKINPKGGPVPPPGKADDVAEWQGLYTLRLTNRRLAGLLGGVAPAAARLASVAQYAEAAGGDDAVRRVIRADLGRLRDAAVPPVAVETIRLDVAGTERTAHVVRERGRPGYRIAPTDVLFYKDIKVGDKTALGIGVFDANGQGLTLATTGRLAVDWLVRQAVEARFPNETCAGEFHAWALKSAAGSDLPGVARSAGDTLWCELTVDAARPAQNLAFQKMATARGLPVRFDWQAAADPAARGSITLPLTFGRRADPGFRVRPTRGKAGSTDFGLVAEFPAAVRYVMLDGKLQTVPQPLVFQPGVWREFPTDRKLFLPAEGTELDVNDTGKLLGEFQLQVADDFSDRVKVRNLVQQPHPTHGRLYYIEVKLSASYAADGRRAVLDGPRFNLAAFPAEGAEYSRPFIFPRGAADRKYRVEATAIYENGRQTATTETGDAIIMLTEDTFNVKR